MQLINQNLSTNYEIHGKGSPLIMLHGWGTDLKSFALITPELAKHYKVHLIDLPGFGKTQTPKKDWNVDNYVKFIQDFLKKLDIKKATFLGHSFGGRILIKLAAKKPELFEILILTGAAGIKPKNSLKKTIFKTMAKTGKRILCLPGMNKFQAKARQKLYQASGSTDYLNAGQLKKTFLNVINEDLTPYVSQIKSPTLLIWGENDQDTPLSDAIKIHKLIPHSELKIIPNAGHYAFIDQFKTFLKLIYNPHKTFS